MNNPDNWHAETFVIERIGERNGRVRDIGWDGGTGTGWPKEATTDPVVGDIVTRYSTGSWGMTTGFDINGVSVYYQTRKEYEDERLARIAEQDAKKQRDWEKNEPDYRKRISVLPFAYQKRFNRMENNNPNFGKEYMGYELFTAEEANKFAQWALTANPLAPEEALIEFKDMPYENQQKIGMSDGHSGNTFGMAVVLARFQVRGDWEAVEQMHAAMSALMGCVDVGCHTDADFGKESN